MAQGLRGSFESSAFAELTANQQGSNPFEKGCCLERIDTFMG